MGKTNNVLTGIEYERTIFSPRWYMENMLYIVDKNGNLIKFKLNKEQRALLRHIEFCLGNGIPVRMIILKARQIGLTTFCVGFGYWHTSMNKNKNYGIVAHRLDSAQSIFEKTKIFYNNIPRELRPQTTQFSSEGIKFDKKDGTGINSRIQFATVSEGVFRGQTLSYLHLSECAFWDGNVQAIENSLSPTVALAPGTIIIRESTANGYNQFKEDWDRAVRGDSDYTPFFFGWQDHEEYQLPAPKGFGETLTDKEKKLKEKFKLTDDQLYWRRRTIANDYKGNEMWFEQEYPMTPEEAFVASGTSVFGNETIKAGYEMAKAPIDEIDLKSYPVYEKLQIWEYPRTETEKIYAKKSEWNFDKQEYEYVDTDLLLEELTYKTPYTVGIDTSGLGSNMNQVVVVDNTTKRMVARFGTKIISEEHLAMIAVEIAKMYNDALIAPEVNYSHEICNFILKLGYKRLYITENVTRQDGKIVSGIEYGWKTTTSTKPPIISALRARINADPSCIPDKEFWYEAEYYIMEDVQKNIMNASSGHFDDIIMATAIAMYVSDSPQSKQTRMVVRDVKEQQGGENFLFGLLRKQKQSGKTKIRKGLYRNNA
jgi:hypothetical protein